MCLEPRLAELLQHVARPAVSVSPKGAFGAHLTVGIVGAFFMRAADDTVTQHDPISLHVL